ncbi:MAG: lasso peptide biosynthesis PqqD family chaperone [Tenuifilaceae bacterium]
MNSITLNTTIKRNPELVASDMDGETVMMSIDNGEYFGLDPVGSRIWTLIENPVRIDKLIEQLLEEFDVTKEQCELDTLEFLNQLQDKNLLIILS